MRESLVFQIGVISFITLFTTTGCSRAVGARVLEAAPGGQEESAPGGGGELGASLGNADSQINADEYFSPVGTPFEWTSDMTENVLAALPAACPGGDASQQDTKAFAIGGDCQVFSIGDARSQVNNIGILYAKQGTDLRQIIAAEAASAALQTDPAAIPAVDLGSIINQQNASGQAVTTENPSSALMLSDAPSLDLGDEWQGGGRNYTVGSGQFALTTTGYFYVKYKNGFGLRNSADLTGKAFSVQRSILYAKVSGVAFTVGQRGEVGLQVQVFGQDAYNQSYQEPQYQIEKDLLSLNHSFPGSIKFAIGPVPFSVTWAFHVTGGVPVTLTLRSTSVGGGIKPNAGSSVSLEGGADIVVAKAGVEGNLNIFTAQFNSNATVALSTNSDGHPAVCYDAVVDLSLNNLLGGSLMAFVQVGRPDIKILRVPLGWRGSLKFVDWQGTTYDLPIINANQQCLASN